MATTAEQVLQSFKDGVCDDCAHLSFAVLGASGDLAKKKIYPVLWSLVEHNLIDSENTTFVGYARSQLDQNKLSERLKPYLKVSVPGKESKLEEFLQAQQYVSGQYDKQDSFQQLNGFLNEIFAASGKEKDNRIFYLALPPSVFEPVTTNLSQACMSKSGWTRVIVEKPFGKDSASFATLSNHMEKLFSEDQIYRIDHYLGKEMVQNLILLRFSNRILTPAWHRDHIACVVITLKEPFGTKGRGGYFDEFGIIRDVMQNHLLQILTLVAMEKPVSSAPDDIRDEKVKVLKAIRPLKLEDVVLGQYVAAKQPKDDESKYGYKDDDGVPATSNTPTFATAAFQINNERWDGVPFIIKCGKALDQKKAEVRIQFKDQPADIFKNTVRNELVIRVQPDEAVYLKMNVKSPGMSFEMEQTDLDLSYKKRFEGVRLPDAYERLVLEVIRGSALHFVRTDELKEAWRIFTPLLHNIDAGRIKPIEYEFGSRGPVESDVMIKDLGYKYTQYSWHE
eukprot:gene1998-5073_t